MGRVKIKKMWMIGYWNWLCGDDMCSICSESFEMTCPQCSRPGDTCPPAFGECGHAFHLHCIHEWLARARNDSGMCPMCRREFRFQVTSSSLSSQSLKV
ncbi:zinc C3HC4 type domain-containing protein [Cryptosporidium andersoni]|uniref:Anaphase-promoting complex subunit 11 n=1 Tax=Cryptosporidium andersoni TaxID=117008 RepID=A0A1J4MAD3_9CRYT|nr:zinc C3HC4 type domain-containing protein [Cryptosporidium andersoni]